MVTINEFKKRILTTIAHNKEPVFLKVNENEYIRYLIPHYNNRQFIKHRGLEKFHTHNIIINKANRSIKYITYINNAKNIISDLPESLFEAFINIMETSNNLNADLK